MKNTVFIIGINHLGRTMHWSDIGKYWVYQVADLLDETIPEKESEYARYWRKNFRHGNKRQLT